MCEPAPRVVYVHPAISGAGLLVTAVVGSGVALYAVAGGSTITAWALLGLTGYSAITTILLLAKRANPVRQAPAAVPVRRPARTAVRAQAAIVAHTTPTLPAATPLGIDGTATPAAVPTSARRA